jgi:hypothetical protein
MLRCTVSTCSCTGYLSYGVHRFSLVFTADIYGVVEKRWIINNQGTIILLLLQTKYNLT